MSKQLKTGDVKRYPRHLCREVVPGDTWATVGHVPVGDVVWSWPTREEARHWKFGDRVARVLSIGPKLVTVRIEK